MTSEQYAQALVQRYNSMRTDVPEEKLFQIFLGAKDSIQEHVLGPQVAQELRDAYELAQKELFPETRQTETQPDESLDQELKRSSQEDHPSGRLVKGSNLGPFTIFSTTPSWKPKPVNNLGATGPESARKPLTDLQGNGQTGLEETNEKVGSSRVAPSEDQLRGLLNDSLVQLITPKPSADASVPTSKAKRESDQS